MRTLYADFNDMAEDGVLPLTCAGSVESIRALDPKLEDGEDVLLTDGELIAEASVFRLSDGTWEARSSWRFQSEPPSPLPGR